MKTRKLDLVLCNWSILGVIPIVIAGFTHNFEDTPRLSLIVSIVYGGGWIIAIGYGLYRVSQLKFPSKQVIIWVIALLWFSVISLPWLYWKHLRKEPKTVEG